MLFLAVMMDFVLPAQIKRIHTGLSWEQPRLFHMPAKIFIAALEEGIPHVREDLTPIE